MLDWVRRVVNDQRFNAFIVGVILVNAVLVGLETSETVLAGYGSVLELVNMIIVGIFVVEIGLRLVSYWPRPFAFFRDGWNVFDFVVVTLSLLPAVHSFPTRRSSDLDRKSVV